MHFYKKREEAVGSDLVAVILQGWPMLILILLGAGYSGIIIWLLVSLKKIFWPDPILLEMPFTLIFTIISPYNLNPIFDSHICFLCILKFSFIVYCQILVWKLFLDSEVRSLLLQLQDRLWNPSNFPKPFIRGFWEGFWWAFVTMTTVGWATIEYVSESIILIHSTSFRGPSICQWSRIKNTAIFKS